MNRRTFLKKSSLAGVGFSLVPWISALELQKPSPEKMAGPPLAGKKDMKFLVLAGSPRERGRIHGETLRHEIREMIETNVAGLRAAGLKPEDYINLITEKTGFIAAAERWTPHLVEEMKGIGEGAGLDFKTTFTWNLLDESDWFFNEKRWVNPSSANTGRCSAFGVGREGDAPSLIAQNADMGPSFDGHQTLLHIKHADSDLEELVLTCPGCVGIYGLNNRSIGVCLNALTMQLNKSPSGLGTIFIARGILAQKTWDEAVKFVQSVQHASGEAYTIGGPERVACFEGSASKVSQFIPNPEANRVYHTNHPLVNDDLWLDIKTIERMAPELRERFKKGILNSETRLQALKTRLDDLAKPVTIERAKSILRSHDSPEFPVCRHGKPGEGDITTYSMIMVLKPSPEIHVAPGPPCKTEFTTYKF
jgi:isopenicillin-N N-acyltransferase-like protein